MWTSNGGTFYDGDCQPGDRAATAEELAVIALARAKRDKGSDIAAVYAAALAAGLLWQAKVYQIDQVSQGRIGNRAQVARDCVAGTRTWLPVYEGWIAADNSRAHAFTAQEFLDFAYAAHDRFTAIVLNANRLKADLEAATTLAAVAAIDANTGWPA